jgi:hypothetical protein
LFEQDHQGYDGCVVGRWLGARDQQAPIHHLVSAAVSSYVDNLIAGHPISLTEFPESPLKLSTADALVSQLLP